MPGITSFKENEGRVKTNFRKASSSVNRSSRIPQAGRRSGVDSELSLQITCTGACACPQLAPATARVMEVS
jgi:hypothetical protein